MCALGGVDQLFKSLSAASCEVAVNSSKAPTGRAPSGRGTSSAAGGKVSTAEREKALNYVSQTLRFVLAHNTKNKDADLEAVETVSTPSTRMGGPGFGRLSCVCVGVRTSCSCCGRALWCRLNPDAQLQALCPLPWYDALLLLGHKRRRQGH